MPVAGVKLGVTLELGLNLGSGSAQACFCSSSSLVLTLLVSETVCSGLSGKPVAAQWCQHNAEIHSELHDQMGVVAGGIFKIQGHSLNSSCHPARPLKCLPSGKLRKDIQVFMNAHSAMFSLTVNAGKLFQFQILYMQCCHPF